MYRYATRRRSSGVASMFGDTRSTGWRLPPTSGCATSALELLGAAGCILDALANSAATQNFDRRIERAWRHAGREASTRAIGAWRALLLHRPRPVHATSVPERPRSASGNAPANWPCRSANLPGHRRPKDTPEQPKQPEPFPGAGTNCAPNAGTLQTDRRPAMSTTTCLAAVGLSQELLLAEEAPVPASPKPASSSTPPPFAKPPDLGLLRNRRPRRNLAECNRSWNCVDKSPPATEPIRGGGRGQLPHFCFSRAAGVL